MRPPGSPGNEFGFALPLECPALLVGIAHCWMGITLGSQRACISGLCVAGLYVTGLCSAGFAPLSSAAWQSGGRFWWSTVWGKRDHSHSLKAERKRVFLGGDSYGCNGKRPAHHSGAAAHSPHSSPCGHGQSGKTLHGFGSGSKVRCYP